MDDHQKELDKKEELRKDALYSQNGLNYYKLSMSLGINPENLEDKHLYEQGEIEYTRLETKKKEEKIRESQLEKEVRKSEHRLIEKEFLKRAEELNINDFYAQTDAKIMFLQDYFPGKFGRGKKQDIEKFDDVQVGAIFKNVYDSYKKKHR